MVIYRFKERDYAEKIEKYGFQTNYIMYELKVLAKYYKEQGHKPKQREEKIYNFCEEHIKNFNKVKYFRKIRSVLNYATNKKNKTLQIYKIEITKSELDYINGLEISDLHKKVLFCLLVENKLSRQVSKIINDGVEGYKGVVFGGDKKGVYRDLCEVAEVKDYKQINEIINDLSGYKISDDPNIEDTEADKTRNLVNVLGRGKIALNFINEIGELNEDDNNIDEVACEINTFDNIGLFYDFYMGDEKVKICEGENCNRLIRMKSNRSKYCDDCWREINKKQIKERVRKHRENKDVTV